MQIKIEHVEKKQGLIFKKTLYGVALTINFNGEEEGIIEQRKLQKDVILERGIPADVDADKHSNRGIVKVLATAAVKGMDANNFHLTINKLMVGTDTYFFETPLEAKQYEAELKELLPNFKEYIMGNAELGGSDTFEL